MNYKRKPKTVKVEVVRYDPVPLEDLIAVLMSPSFERYFNQQAKEILEFTLHPYVMETDLWSIQLYRMSRPCQWELLKPSVQHAWLRKLKAIPGA